MQLNANIREACACFAHGVSPKLICNAVETAALQEARATTARAVSQWRSPKLHQYCCEPDSVLADAAGHHGYRYQRWTEQNCDLSLAHDVRQVEQCIRKDIQEGQVVCLWISLPCTAWCSWQRLSESRSGHPAQYERLVRTPGT